MGETDALKSEFGAIVALKHYGWDTALLKSLNSVVDDAAKAGALGGSRFAIIMAEAALVIAKTVTAEIQNEFFQCLEAGSIEVTDETQSDLAKIASAQVLASIAQTRQLLTSHSSIRPNPAFGDHGSRGAIASKMFDAEALRLSQISDAELLRTLKKLKRRTLLRGKVAQPAAGETIQKSGQHSIVSPEASQSLALAGFGIGGALATNVNQFLYYVGLCFAALSVILIVWVYRRAMSSDRSLTVLFFPGFLICAVALFAGGMVIHWGKKSSEVQQVANAASSQLADSQVPLAAARAKSETARSSDTKRISPASYDNNEPQSSQSAAVQNQTSQAAVTSSAALAPISSSSTASVATSSIGARYTVRVDCIQSKLPTVVPVSSQLNYISLAFENGKLGYSQYMISYPDKPGSKIRGADKVWGPTYLCTVINTGDVTLYDVFLNADVFVNEVIRDENVFSEGKQLSKTTQIIHIDKLENNPSHTFKVFVFSKSDHLYYLQVNKSFSARPEEGERRIEADIKGDRSDRRISIWPTGW